MACMENRKQKPKRNIKGLLDMWREQLTKDPGHVAVQDCGAVSAVLAQARGKQTVEAKLGWGCPGKWRSGIEVLGKLGKRGREDRRRLRGSQWKV